MKFTCAIFLVCALYFVTAQECKYVRFETNTEAVLRAVFERCLITCSESSMDSNPCYNCMVPYKSYGCLLKIDEMAGCEMDCALQPDVELFTDCHLRCAQKRRMLKKLRGLKKIHY